MQGEFSLPTPIQSPSEKEIEICRIRSMIGYDCGELLYQSAKILSFSGKLPLVGSTKAHGGYAGAPYPASRTLTSPAGTYTHTQIDRQIDT